MIPLMRERLLMDRNWRFALGHATNPARDFDFVRDRSLVKAGEARGAAAVNFDDSKWRQIDLPHDWAIELPLDPKGDKELCDHGFYAIGPDHPESSIGWYRRTFAIPKSDLGKRISVEFDGVFRDSIVWINGHRLGRHASGYVPFRYDLTDYLNYGHKNVLVLRADASCYEGWWYEGAGIYRQVWLLKTAPLHIAPYGTFVTSTVKRTSATITIRTTVANDSDDPASFVLQSKIKNQKPKIVQRSARLAAWSKIELSQQIRISNPRLWSCDTPHLYNLQSVVQVGGRTLDTYDTTFGIRTLRWDTKRGFFLNNKPLKIKGTCNHRDHAGVGVALPDRLHQLRIEKLKELGCNAYRASHYPNAPETLDACDRLGLLVMAENRLAGSSPQNLEDLKTLILRDRNHPSVFLWSLANEEHTVQWSIIGERIGRTMANLVHRLDPTRKVTAAMHDKGLSVGFANIVDVHGWNYINVGRLDAYHKAHPNRLIIGSEEASTVCTRGIYADDPKKGYVSAYDNRAPKWGSTAEHWWRFFLARPWLAGGFVWTGFDHRGEPIPYKWPCTLSHFGIMDLCGFPKDNYYYYKSWWTNEPVLHLFPHWTWPGREGEEIDVRCFTNHDEVELFLNNKSLGRETVPRNSHVARKVPYHPGVIEARAYRNGKLVATTSHQTTGRPRRIALAVDRASINADGQDIACITASILDENNLPIPTASNLIHFAIKGPAKLLGVGNGDPSSHESDKAPFRKLFNGLCLAIIQSNRTPGPITIHATSKGVTPARMTLSSSPSRPIPAVP